MAISLLLTGASIEDVLLLLKWILYIYYLLQFQKDIADVRALIDFGSKVNAMTPAYVSKLDLRACHTNIRVQKIDGSTL